MQRKPYKNMDKEKEKEKESDNSGSIVKQKVAFFNHLEDLNSNDQLLPLKPLPKAYRKSIHVSALTEKFNAEQKPKIPLNKCSRSTIGAPVVRPTIPPLLLARSKSKDSLVSPEVASERYIHAWLSPRGKKQFRLSLNTLITNAMDYFLYGLIIKCESDERKVLNETRQQIFITTQHDLFNLEKQYCTILVNESFARRIIILREMVNNFFNHALENYFSFNKGEFEDLSNELAIAIQKVCAIQGTPNQMIEDFQFQHLPPILRKSIKAKGLGEEYEILLKNLLNEINETQEQIKVNEFHLTACKKNIKHSFLAKEAFISFDQLIHDITEDCAHLDNKKALKKLLLSCFCYVNKSIKYQLFNTKSPAKFKKTADCLFFKKTAYFQLEKLIAKALIENKRENLSSLKPILIKSLDEWILSYNADFTHTATASQKFKL